MAVRQIRIIGDEILTKKAKKVDVVDEKIVELLDDMYETMKKTNDGIGLVSVAGGN